MFVYTNNKHSVNILFLLCGLQFKLICTHKQVSILRKKNKIKSNKQLVAKK